MKFVLILAAILLPVGSATAQAHTMYIVPPGAEPATREVVSDLERAITTDGRFKLVTTAEFESTAAEFAVELHCGEAGFTNRAPASAIVDACSVVLGYYPPSARPLFLVVGSVLAIGNPGEVVRTAYGNIESLVDGAQESADALVARIGRFCSAAANARTCGRTK